MRFKRRLVVNLQKIRHMIALANHARLFRRDPQKDVARKQRLLELNGLPSIFVNGPDAGKRGGDLVPPALFHNLLLASRPRMGHEPLQCHFARVGNRASPVNRNAEVNTIPRKIRLAPPPPIRPSLARQPIPSRPATNSTDDSRERRLLFQSDDRDRSQPAPTAKGRQAAGN